MGSININVEIPDYATRFDMLSMTACFLDLRGAGEEARQATGFFWRHEKKVYLFTNWHVVTGRNIFNGQNIGHGWCPESISVEFFEKPPIFDTTIIADQSKISRTYRKLELRLYEDFYEPFWIQHRNTFDQNIDIVGIEIDDFDEDRIQCINDTEFPKLYQFAGSDVFVLGFPILKKHFRIPTMMPVWKRGSIATELMAPWNARPAFLIDSRTSAGMSGSPVFSRVFGPAAHGDGTIRSDSILTSEFVGIYSGRIFDDDNNASLGTVWYRNLLTEILDTPGKGSRDWRPSDIPNASDVLGS